jgi:hypothetical protein
MDTRRLESDRETEPPARLRPVPALEPPQTVDDRLGGGSPFRTSRHRHRRLYIELTAVEGCIVPGDCVQADGVASLKGFPCQQMSWRENGFRAARANPSDTYFPFNGVRWDGDSTTSPLCLTADK